MADIVENLWQDLRFGLRQLRRAPGFTLTAVVTLALGIGVNTAIFSLLDQALLRSLPVRDPGQLVVLRGTGEVWEGHSSSHGNHDADASFSVPMYRDLRDHDPAFAGLLATSPVTVDLTQHGSAQVLSAELVSGNYFTLLGVTPVLGRVFTQAEDTDPEAHPVAVLSYKFWRNGMHADPAVVGSTVSLNGHPFQVVGVAAPGFQSAVWGEAPNLFMPLSMTDQIIPDSARRLTDHKDRWLNVLGRLRPGIGIAQAQAQSAPLWHALRAEELKALGRRSPRFIAEFLTNSRLLLQPAARGYSYARDTYRPLLLAMMAMAAVVLLLAMSNVAGLLLVRSFLRAREFSMRVALGAAAARVWQQLLIEGLLIGLSGGLLGLLLAPLGTRAIIGYLAGNDNTAFQSSLNLRLLAFTVLIAIMVSVVFSLAPALWLRRPDLTLAMRQGSSSALGGGFLLRRIIVGTQLAMSLLLLVGAGLFVRTMQRLRSEDVGFPTHHIAVFRVTPRLAGYEADRMPALRLQLLEALSTMPGVEDVGIGSEPLLHGNSSGSNITLENYHPAPEEDMDVETNNVSPRFFSTLGVPLVIGRTLMVNDDATHPLVAVVNEAFAKRYFGSPQRALGQRLMDGASNHPVFDTEIVGVVRDFRQRSVRDNAVPTLFRPVAQGGKKDATRTLYFFHRTAVAPATLLHAMQQRVTGVDPLLAIDQLRTLDEQVDDYLQNERLIASLAVAFGGLAAVLAGVGLYGVLAFVTAQRTREIGVRMALGASRWSVSQLVLADVLKMTIGGTVVGLASAIPLAHLLRSQLYGVSPTDPLSLLAAVMSLTVVALLAAALPARRAASVHPTEALRTE